MLLLWLSIIIMIPFDMYRLDGASDGSVTDGGTKTPITQRIIEFGKVALLDVFKPVVVVKFAFVYVIYKVFLTSLFSMPMPGQSGRRRHYVLGCPVVHLSVHSSCYQMLEHGILKANWPILMQTDTSGLWIKGVKRSTCGVMSKVSVTQRQTKSQK